MDVGDVLGRLGARCSAADAAFKRDVKATVTALVWTHFQVTWANRSIKPRPVKVVEPLVQFAGHG